jgi:hypothetical protein
MNELDCDLLANPLNSTEIIGFKSYIDGNRGSWCLSWAPTLTQKGPRTRHQDISATRALQMTWLLESALFLAICPDTQGIFHPRPALHNISTFALLLDIHASRRPESSPGWGRLGASSLSPSDFRFSSVSAFYGNLSSHVHASTTSVT